MSTQTSQGPTTKPKPSRPLRRRVALLLGVCLFTWLLLEGMLGTYFAMVQGNTYRFLFLEQDLADREAIAEYVEQRHDLLGWLPGGGETKDHLDATDSRLSPAFPVPGNAYASLYGNSFTWGDDVDDTDAWGNQLAILLGRRVANYGVPGYGVDQAVLRFEGNVSDEAEWAVLTVYPNNFLRNLTHNIGFVILPGFHYHNLKPRFSLDEQGGLRLHEIPFRSEEELFAYAQDPIAFLQDDWFYPKGYWAQKTLVTFPYAGTLYRFVVSDKFCKLIRRKVSGEPLHHDYYQQGHSSRCAEIGVALCDRFARIAQSRGKRHLVVVLPDVDIMSYFQRSGRWSHQAIVDGIANSSPVLNMGQVFVDHLEGRPFQEVNAPGGHYNAEGYRILAQAVYEKITNLSQRELPPE